MLWPNEWWKTHGLTCLCSVQKKISVGICSTPRTVRATALKEISFFSGIKNIDKYILHFQQK